MIRRPRRPSKFLCVSELRNPCGKILINFVTVRIGFLAPMAHWCGGFYGRGAIAIATMRPRGPAMSVDRCVDLAIEALAVSKSVANQRYWEYMHKHVASDAHDTVGVTRGMALPKS